MKPQSITALPAAPAADRGHRMLEYTIMMSIRVLCLVSLLWVRGWWILVPAAGAIFLPYFAVVVANVARARPAAPERPGAIVRVDGVPGAGTWQEAGGRPGTGEQGTGEQGTGEQGSGERGTGEEDGGEQRAGEGRPADASTSPGASATGDRRPPGSRA
jgi:hypothetical protein